jgi:hypothetical protein
MIKVYFEKLPWELLAETEKTQEMTRYTVSLWPREDSGNLNPEIWA